VSSYLISILVIILVTTEIIAVTSSREESGVITTTITNISTNSRIIVNVTATVEQVGEISSLLFFIDRELTTSLIMSEMIKQGPASTWRTIVYLLPGKYYFSFMITLVNRTSIFHEYGEVLFKLDSPASGKQASYQLSLMVTLGLTVLLVVTQVFENYRRWKKIAEKGEDKMNTFEKQLSTNALSRVERW
jgi:hypothetical protein